MNMKKLSLVLLATVFTLSIYSCRETTENNETNVDDVEAELEEAGNDIEEGAEEVGNEIEAGAEEVEAEVEGTDDI
jgi:hypothetical protein